VLVVRVKHLVEKAVWERRYEHINAFERLLADEGVVIRKFFLHISKGYQRKRLQRRLDRPDKRWKFDPNDLAERARWKEYRVAYEAALERCSSDDAPWYVVPAETRWFRDLLVASVIAETLREMDPAPPRESFDAAAVRIAD
jgi:polyphosphate kinase 2 (PPK2 family)